MTTDKSDIKKLASKIDQTEYTRCLKQMYKQISQLLVSHHLMTRFHNDYDQNEILMSIISE